MKPTVSFLAATVLGHFDEDVTLCSETMKFTTYGAILSLSDDDRSFVKGALKFVIALCS